MCVLPEHQILVYGLGDEGFGCVYLARDFMMFECNSGVEKDKLSVAKTTMYASSRGDGFVWKVGGYTAVTGAGS